MLSYHSSVHQASPEKVPRSVTVTATSPAQSISFSFQQSNAPAGFRGTVYPSDVLALVRAASG